MLRLKATIQKELLILFRDKGGLAILFLMPMAMITIMALIQDAPFKDYQELKIPLLLVNKDTSTLGKLVEKGLHDAKIFEIKTENTTTENLKQEIKAGNYVVGIILPENATSILNTKVDAFVNKKIADIGLGDTSKLLNSVQSDKLFFTIIFAPDTKQSFKSSILTSLKSSISKIETQTLIQSFSKELNKEDTKMIENKGMDDFITVEEISTVETSKELLKLNSVQHNVPAWTIFGIFFIVITMSGSIIKERDDGSYTRLKTMPGSFVIVLLGKIIAYLFITIIQAMAMLMVGKFLLPLFGLPQLVMGTSVVAIFSVILFTGLAATGFGMLVGTVFKTHQQSSTFGAVSVVILAALGGIWVPVYVMPESIRMMAEISPLYWSLTAFHKLFLFDGNLVSVLPQILKLFLFFSLTIFISSFYNRWVKK